MLGLNISEAQCESSNEGKTLTNPPVFRHAVSSLHPQRVTGVVNMQYHFHNILRNLNRLLVGTRPQRRMMEDIPCTY